MTLRLVLAGSGPFVEPVFKALTAHGCDLAAIVTQPDAPAGRGRRQQEQNVATLAHQLGIAVFKPLDINSPDSLEQLESYQATLFLSASFGQFAGKSLLMLFPDGCWNLHPSLLPAYRGATPVNAALRDGLTKTGVTLFRMIKKMDAGPIAATISLDIVPEETAGELLLRCAQLAGQLAVDTLPRLVRGDVTYRDQDNTQASYCGKLDKNSGCLDWTLDATALVNLSRSVDPWPGAWTTLRGQRLNLARFKTIEATSTNPLPGTILKVSPEKIVVACAQGSVSPTLWQWAGKKVLGPRDFLNGTRLQLGERFDPKSAEW